MPVAPAVGAARAGAGALRVPRRARWHGGPDGAEMPRKPESALRSPSN